MKSAGHILEGRMEYVKDVNMMKEQVKVEFAWKDKAKGNSVTVFFLGVGPRGDKELEV